jgi:hypothetical protein
MEHLMSTILNVSELQAELDNAARDAKHGPAEVRAGKFVHQEALAKLASNQNGRTLFATQENKRRPYPD